MYKVKFADIGEGLTEGKVAEVLVKEGDKVKAGDSLFFVETDKVNSEIPSPVDGIIAKVFIKPDQEIKVGEVIFEIDDSQTAAVDAAEAQEPKTVAPPDTPPESNVQAVLDADQVAKTEANQTPVTSQLTEPEKKTQPEEENASVVGSTPVSNNLLPPRRPRGQQPNQTSDSSDVEQSRDQSVKGTSQAEPIKNEPKEKFDQTKYDYEVIIIGGGVGGYTAAIRAAQFGLKVLLIEKGQYGGVCLNVGCIPTKTMLKSAKLFDQTKNKLKPFGVELSSNAKITLDWPAVLHRKDDVINKLRNGVMYLLKKNKVDHIEGLAEVADKHSVKINGKTITTRDLIVATGSNPKSLPLPGFAEAHKNGFLIDSTRALELPKIPKTMVIIGGGVIGVEFACLFSNCGTKVTLLQGLPTILEMLDTDIAQEMAKLMHEKYLINIISNVKLIDIKDNTINYEVDGKKASITADYCLEAVGRGARLNGLENLKLDLTPRGFINTTSPFGQTSLDNVYAIGDVNGHMMLAHVAAHEGLVAANHIALKSGLPGAENLVLDYNEIPSCIYSHPEIAVIGLTERAVKESKLDYEAYKFPFTAVGKAIADGHPYGFVKLIADKKTGKILGAHILGNRATEMISEITAIMASEGTIAELATMVHPHPTMSEAIGEAAFELYTGKELNI